MKAFKARLQCAFLSILLLFAAFPKEVKSMNAIVAFHCTDHTSSSPSSRRMTRQKGLEASPSEEAGEGAEEEEAVAQEVGNTDPRVYGVGLFARRKQRKPERIIRQD